MFVEAEIVMDIIDAFKELFNMFFSVGRLLVLFVNDFFNTPWKFDEPGKEFVRKVRSLPTQESGASIDGQNSAKAPGGFSEMLKLEGDVPPSLRLSSRAPRPGQQNDSATNSTGNVAPDDPFFNITSLPTAPNRGVPRTNHADKYSPDYETLASLDRSALFPAMKDEKKDK